MPPDEDATPGEATPVRPITKPRQPSARPANLKPSRPAPHPGARRVSAAGKMGVLEPCEPIPPLTPEELAAPIARGFFDPDAAAPDDALPVPVRIAFEELAFALRSLGVEERAATLARIAAELPRRIVG